MRQVRLSHNKTARFHSASRTKREGPTYLKGLFKPCSSFRHESTTEFIHEFTLSGLYLRV